MYLIDKDIDLSEYRIQLVPLEEKEVSFYETFKIRIDLLKN
jgi:hypothetical protein